MNLTTNSQRSKLHIAMLEALSKAHAWADVIASEIDRQVTLNGEGAKHVDVWADALRSKHDPGMVNFALGLVGIHPQEADGSDKMVWTDRGEGWGKQRPLDTVTVWLRPDLLG